MKNMHCMHRRVLGAPKTNANVNERFILNYDYFLKSWIFNQLIKGQANYSNNSFLLKSSPEDSQAVIYSTHSHVSIIHSCPVLYRD